VGFLFLGQESLEIKPARKAERKKRDSDVPTKRMEGLKLDKS
jgi:hypothetical protein